MTLNPTRILIAALAAASLALLPGAAQAASKQVICKDGSKDEGGRGACSGHGGIDKAATSKAAADAKAEAKAKKDEAKKEKAAAKAEAKAKKDEAKKEAKEPKAAAAKADAGATVSCKDGTTSKAGRGACRGHGGVDKGGGAKAAMPAAPAATAPAAASAASAAPAAPAQRSAAPAKADPAKGPPTARCKDGSFSYAEHHTGACSNHGGVEEWLDKK